MSKNVPVTEWRPPGDTGEMSNIPSSDIITQDGDFLVTQDGDFLITGISLFTIKPDTLWTTGIVPSGALQSENSLYILTEMSDYIETEDSVPGQGELPATRWSPPVQGEMTNVSSNDLVTQLGDFLVTQDGDMLITSDSLYTTTPKTEWEENDAI